MLYGFVCKNFSSYKDESVFTMLADNIKEYDDINTFESKHGKVLKSALIYGANGGGKSNYIDAIQKMREMVGISMLDRRTIGSIESFKFNKDSLKEPICFEINFSIEDILYTYGFEILNNTINKEWLYKKVSRTVMLLNRKSSDWKDIELCGELKSAEEIKRYTRKDTLFISTACNFNIELADKIVTWFSEIKILGSDLNPSYTIEYMDKNSYAKEQIVKYLQKADIGIEDLSYQIESEELPSTEDNSLLRDLINSLEVDGNNVELKIAKQSIDIKTKHTIYDNDKNAYESILIPFTRYQSEGTKKLFTLLGPILESLQKGSVLIIDEIDSKLHPSILRLILSMYNSIHMNKKNAQLICTTHDVLLLNEDIRRDQVWFVEKNSYGESQLYSLMDFRGVRKDDPILKNYLLGAYGAIPFKQGSDVL